VQDSGESDESSESDDDVTNSILTITHSVDYKCIGNTKEV